MDTKFIMNDIIDALKLIKNDNAKQKKVNDLLDTLINDYQPTEHYHSKEDSDIVPLDIVNKLTHIRHDGNKLLKILTFIENEILKKPENKTEREILDKYDDIVFDIVNSVENGFTVYLNPKTLEMEEVESDTLYNMKEFEEMHDDLLDEYELDYMKWDSYIRFEPFGYYDANTIMEDFVNQLNDSSLANRLEDALSIRESPDEFLEIINESANAKKAWNKYNRKELEKYVKSHLVDVLKRKAQLSSWDVEQSTN